MRKVKAEIGEARAVLQDVASYEKTQTTWSLLKILALGNQELAQGNVKPVANVVCRLRAKRTQRINQFGYQRIQTGIFQTLPIDLPRLRPASGGLLDRRWTAGHAGIA